MLKEINLDKVNSTAQYNSYDDLQSELGSVKAVLRVLNEL